MPAPPQQHPTYQGGISSYNPSLREKLVYALQGGLGLGDDRQGVRRARYLTSALEMVPPIGLATGLEDAVGSGQRGDYLGAGMDLAMAGLPGPPIKKGIRAFHGSPHDFEKFDLSKIGTGEGAQAYGHGLYFAENEGVAKSYKDAGPAFYENVNKINDQMKAVSKRMDELSLMSGGGYRKWKPEHREEGLALSKEYDALMEKRANLGHTYEVEINADPEQFLDWDKPLSEQMTPNLEKALGENNPFKHADARVALKQGAFSVSDEGTAKKLREAGIPGIKYLDQGSRGKGEGSRNFVVFDDKLLDIKRKYGISGLLAALGIAGATGYTDDAQAQTPQTQGGW